MKKVLFTAKVVKLHINVFHIPFLRMFREAGWETSVAARNDFENPSDCFIPYCDHFYNMEFGRNPFSPQNIRLYQELKKTIETGEYDLIHTHTPIVSILTRLAARKSNARVIYTAHGFHFFKGAPLFNWLVYYPAEKLCSRWTDTLITINNEDYDRAVKKFHAKRVEYVPGVGVDIERFRKISADRIEKRKELGIPENAYLMLSAGELVGNKNHQLVIRAMAETGDPALHYAVAGIGNEKEKLEQLSESLGIKERVHFIGYRKDMAELYKTADLVIHPSLREGLPVVVMEAMASGALTIVSTARGNRDLLPKEYQFNSGSVADLKERIRECREGKLLPVSLPEEYSIESVQQRMKEIYGL